MLEIPPLSRNLSCNQCTRPGIGEGLRSESQDMQQNRRVWQTMDELVAAAQEGDAAAQTYLARCYQTGQGVKQDDAEAVRWFRRAAEQNDSTAQCYLGFCYQMGTGVPQELREAARWFREAAEQG